MPRELSKMVVPGNTSEEGVGVAATRAEFSYLECNRDPRASENRAAASQPVEQDLGDRSGAWIPFVLDSGCPWYLPLLSS